MLDYSAVSNPSQRWEADSDFQVSKVDRRARGTSEKCPEAKNPSARGSLLLLPIANLFLWFTERILL
jgi:hypothetical protein